MVSQRAMIAGLLAAAALAGCRSDRVTSLGAPVAFSADAWSGGTLVLESSAFSGADSLPIVMVGSDTLAARTVGRDSVQVTLPDTGGVVTLQIRLRSGGGSAGTVHVHGFIGGVPGPSSEARPYPWPSADATTALTIQGGRLVLVNVTTGSTTTLSSDSLYSPCYRGPVPAFGDSTVVTAGTMVGTTCAVMVALQLDSSSAPPDTGPPYATAGMLLAPGVWLAQSTFGNSDFIYRKVAPDSFVAVTGVPCWPNTDFVPSPRGDRLVLTHCLTLARVPVVDPVALSVAYYLDLATAGGAAFTPGGDTLFIAGGDSTDTRRLLAVDPTNGRVLLQSPPIVGNQAVALDPGHPWVYVAGDVGGVTVEVFDRGTLDKVATLRAPVTALPGAYGNSMEEGLAFFLANFGSRRLYLVFNAGNETAPLYVMQYDLMP